MGRNYGKSIKRNGEKGGEEVRRNV